MRTTCQRLASGGIPQSPPEDEGAGATFQSSHRELPVIDELEALVTLVKHRPRLYLRYSYGPEQDAMDGPSVDYEAGLPLPGLSVTTIAPEPWWTRPAIEWVARRLCKYAELGESAGRRPWLLTGHVAGRGPDHEPVVDIDSVGPVAWIDSGVVHAAHRLYQERFHVGRDSRPSEDE